MPWLQLKLNAKPDTAQHLADLLSEAGASAVTLQDGADQPLYEPPPGVTPLWTQTSVTGLFEADADLDAVLEYLRVALGQDEPPIHRIAPLEDKDWEREWMDNFHPMRFGDRLWICPSWRSPPEPDAVNVLLDPGLAFGTGTHPTTALCLEWLDQHDIAGKDVIDYGCGSGILAVAAAKLGARRVWAVDYDPQALLATTLNAEKNAVDAVITTVLPKDLAAHFPGEPVDLLIANILAKPLIDLAPPFAELVRPGGSIVLSGVLDSQSDDVAGHYQPWFDMAPRVEREEWVRLSGIRICRT
ncbi:MAG: 50S ribosomal protein L11 methyltransferase [Gammaproteobacteria bacterium]